MYDTHDTHDTMNIIPFRSWRRAQIVAPPFTLKEITTGIINPNRSKSSFNVFYSTFCSELNRCDDIQEQARVMGDGLREVQQHFKHIDTANRILNPTSQTKTYGRQDSNADGHTNKTHQLSQSTGKSTLLDVARRVVNRVMNSHQLII